MVRLKFGQQTFFSAFQPTWRYLVAEPYTWLFFCFFQPARFRTAYEQQGFWKRTVLILRLILPLFLLAYPLAVAVQVLLSGCLLSCNGIETSSISMPMLLLIGQATALGIGSGLVVGVLGDMELGMVLSMALGITGITVGNVDVGLAKGVAVAVVLGLVGGTGKGRRWGIMGGTVGSLVGGLAWAIASSLARGTIQGALGAVLVAAAFLVSYLLGYYRLLLYPVSGPSALWAYRASRRNPLQVFAHLHTSSLYWDECVFLPLPYLRQTLLIAVEQDVQLALKETTFILDERPQQRLAALRTSLEVVLHDMEMRESIRDIARTAQRLAEVLPQDATLIDPGWVTPIARLADASREAARYCGPLSWQTRRTALEAMFAHLERIYPHTAFSDTRLNTLLEKVVTTWRAAAKYEQEKLEQGSERVGQIDNPYNPGQVLKLHDPLFVGRRDVVRHLSESLSRGTHRPTFLLNGERRMGKSSTLKQLPNLLGAAYLPIVYDLQVRGVSSSIDVLLGKLAEEIYKTVSRRGMFIEKLERAQLREALYRNDATAYLLFDEWLDRLETVLEREERTVLLLFDEFEKLEEAALAGYLNLNLLLDWFRSTVQNRSHVALLFSGARTFGEMGVNWAGYFVNAKTLKVSFLQPAEAHHLITHPTPNFLSQEMFGEGVVEEIMQVTGCHPFLVQAVCSELIEHLNTENRLRAEIQDVTTAVTSTLDNWWDTYFRDLWDRSDQEQRTCLTTLSLAKACDVLSLTQQTHLDEQAVRRTLQTLLKRDLVLCEKSAYRIVAPIFSQWVERST
jgi:hypothetical protein